MIRLSVWLICILLFWDGWHLDLTVLPILHGSGAGSTCRLFRLRRWDWRCPRGMLGAGLVPGERQWCLPRRNRWICSACDAMKAWARQLDRRRRQGVGKTHRARDTRGGTTQPQQRRWERRRTWIRQRTMTRQLSPITRTGTTTEETTTEENRKAEWLRDGVTWQVRKNGTIGVRLGETAARLDEMLEEQSTAIN